MTAQPKKGTSAPPTFDPSAASTDTPFNIPLAGDLPTAKWIKTSDTVGASHDSLGMAMLHTNHPIQVWQESKPADLVKTLFTMAPEALTALQQKLVSANYLNAKDTGSGKSNVTGLVDTNTLGAYEALLDDVYHYQQMDPSKNMSVDDMLQKRINAYAAGQDSNKTTTKRSQVNLSSPLEAQAFLKGAAKSLLGRDPTPYEISGFTAALRANEQASPAISTTISQPIGAGAIDPSTGLPESASSTVTDGGVSSVAADTLAQGYLMDNNGGDVKQHTSNVAMQSLLSLLGVASLPSLSG